VRIAGLPRDFVSGAFSDYRLVAAGRQPILTVPPIPPEEARAAYLTAVRVFSLSGLCGSVKNGADPGRPRERGGYPGGGTLIRK